jgi:hypothetical protein
MECEGDFNHMKTTMESMYKLEKEDEEMIYNPKIGE